MQTFPVPHDAVDPVGYMFHHGLAALGYLTDLGFATKLVHERVREATTLLIETNHDSALLSADTKRPWSVKQRIMSRHGHLSPTRPPPPWSRRCSRAARSCGAPCSGT